MPGTYGYKEKEFSTSFKTNLRGEHELLEGLHMTINNTAVLIETLSRIRLSSLGSLAAI